MRRGARCAAVLALAAAVAAPSLGAGPEEDYASARAAYQRGDVATAMTLLRPGADQGHAPSQTLLAYILEKADFKEEAVAYYARAAEQGYAEAEYGLGVMYAAGAGVGKDEGQAFALFSRAADKGHAAAIAAVAQAYLGNGPGPRPEERDSAKAAQALRRAAENGYAPAIEGLVRAYRHGGFGLAADPAEARRWEERLKALKRGSGPAKTSKP